MTREIVPRRNKNRRQDRLIFPAALKRTGTTWTGVDDRQGLVIKRIEDNPCSRRLFDGANGRHPSNQLISPFINPPNPSLPPAFDLTTLDSLDHPNSLNINSSTSPPLELHRHSTSLNQPILMIYTDSTIPSSHITLFVRHIILCLTSPPPFSSRSLFP